MKNTERRLLFLLLFALVIILRPDSKFAYKVSHAAGTTLYVDGQIGISTCTDYQPGTRSCGGGTDIAYATLAGAAAVTQPGDVVLPESRYVVVPKLSK